MPSSRLMDDERTLAFVRERELPLAVLVSDQHTRGTLVSMLPDPDDTHGPEYYRGVSDTCAQILKALRADTAPNHRTSVLIITFALLQCMADCGVLTSTPRPDN